MKKRKKKGGAHGFSRELPEQFVERLSTIFGLSRFREIERTFVSRPTTFRVNTLKATSDQVIPLLSSAGFKFQKIQWYPHAFILLNKSKRELTDSQVYLDGKIYIQSLASMVPPIVLDPKPGDTVLDLTAAPGSKTSQIVAHMEKKGELLANDKNKVRFFKLKHNMELLGVVDMKTPIGNEPRPNPPLTGEGTNTGNWKFTLRMEHGAQLSREYAEHFNKILLDVPCSAEARFDTADPKSFGYWSPRKIKEMAYTQRILLRAAWHMLVPGGTLVYSTCTFAPEENEVQIQKFLDRTPDAELIPIELPSLQSALRVDTWNTTVISDMVKKNTFRISPNSQIEGFFVALLRKKIVN